MLFVIAAFNWLINPFSLFKGIKLNNINIRKPAADLNERLSKAYQVTHAKPTGLILGNSRALALPTNHPGWSHKNTYNLALSNGSMYEALRYFQHANNDKQIKELVLSLTIRMFLPGSGHPPQYAESRLKLDINGQPTPYRFMTYFKDVAISSMSVDATRASVKTIKQNKLRRKLNIPHTNNTSCTSHQDQHERVRSQGGHAIFFLKTNKALLKQHWPYQNSTIKREKYFNDSIQYFTRLLRNAYRDDIKLHIVVPPGHALLYETWHIAQLWPIIENWKTSLININEHIAYEYKRNAYPIWDFSNYNSITMETVPNWNDADTAMNWFWETLHFKSLTANLIMGKIFRHKIAGCNIPVDFGVLINKQNIQAHLINTQKMHNEYKQKHTVHIQKLKRIASEL